MRVREYQAWLQAYDEARGWDKISPSHSFLHLIEEVGECEQREIIAALEWSGGNVTGAARRLRIPRSTLRHRIKKYSLDWERPPTRV